jgi:hypothetical protein
MGNSNLLNICDTVVIYLGQKLSYMLVHGFRVLPLNLTESGTQNPLKYGTVSKNSGQSFW